MADSCQYRDRGVLLCTEIIAGTVSGSPLRIRIATTLVASIPVRCGAELNHASIAFTTVSAVMAFAVWFCVERRQSVSDLPIGKREENRVRLRMPLSLLPAVPQEQP